MMLVNYLLMRSQHFSYISDYVSAKENLYSEGLSQELPESEFTEHVSRGKLMHPFGDIYDLSQYFLAYFKKSNHKIATVYCILIIYWPLKFIGFA